MRNIIKILIALFFIISSFLCGKYLSIDKTNEEIIQYKNEINSLKTANDQLTDSLLMLKNHIDSIYLKISTKQVPSKEIICNNK